MAEVPQHITVRQAQECDLPYIDKLQRQFRKALAFLPLTALAEYVRAKVVSIGLLNNEPAGYLLGTSLTRKDPHFAAIYQAAVDYDARFRMLGTALVEQFVSQLPGATRGVQLWCAQDLEANLFWSSTGFHLCGIRPGSSAKKRLVLLWRRPLHGLSLSSLSRFDVRRNPGCTRSREIVTPIREGMTWQNVTLADCLHPAIISLPTPTQVHAAPQIHQEPQQIVVSSTIPAFTPPAGHITHYAGGKLHFRKIRKH